MKKIGFMGLGLMGLPMAINLVKGLGGPILGYDVVFDRRQQFVENGGISTDNAMDIYSSCDIIFTSLPNHDVIINVIEGAINNCKPGTIIVDTSSTAPKIIKSLYEKALDAKMHLLDSPISGGEPGAKAGTLAVMTGGEKEIYDEVKYLLEMIGAPVYTGPSTTGSIAKLANNIIAGAYLVAMSEGYAFASKAGIDPQLLFNATKSGFVGGPLYENKIPKLCNRDFEPGARVAIHRKDIKNAKNLSHDLGIDLPMTDVVLHVMDWMEDNGLINEDQISMVKYFEKKMDTYVEKKSK